MSLFLVTETQQYNSFSKFYTPTIRRRRDTLYVFVIYKQIVSLEPEKSILICEFKIFSAQWFLKLIKTFLGRYSIKLTWTELSFRGEIPGGRGCFRSCTNMVMKHSCEALTHSPIPPLWSCRWDGHRQVHTNGHFIQHQIRKWPRYSQWTRRPVKSQKLWASGEQCPAEINHRGHCGIWRPDK